MVKLRARRCLAGLGVLVLVTVVLGALLGFTSLRFADVEAVAIAVMLCADRVFWPAIERWDRGATGEEAVGEALLPLEAAGWSVLHDVVIGSRGNIDHVVLGPGGLFTVETKSHAGRIQAANIARKMLSQAYAQSKALERITGEAVTPLLVFSNAYLQPAVSRHRGVTVLPGRMLAGHLERRPHALTPARVETLRAQLAATIETDGVSR